MTRDELLKRIEKAAHDKETKLYLSGQGIKELPPEIGQLSSLTNLNLNRNELTSLPPEIGQLTRLKQLYLGENQLTSLPPEIGQLTSLTELIIHSNELTSLPSWIGQLSQLEDLQVDKNQLTSLPPQIGRLSRLRNLEIGASSSGGNPLTRLPLELGELKALELLRLETLELTDPPADVVAQGTNAVLAYLREKLEQGTQIWESRLMVVGEGGVGKTQLLRALNGEDFEVDSETTHGIAVIPLRLEHPTLGPARGQSGGSLVGGIFKRLRGTKEKPSGVTMTLNAWDFGGQDIYHSTHQFFLASRSLFLLCWNSRLGWEQGKLHYWLDTIKALAPGSPVMLVATHIDEREATLPFDDLKEKYPQIIGKWSVSNDQRELGDGIDGLREALRNIAADKENLPLMGETGPASFWNTTEAIRKLKKKETWITAERLWEIMAGNKVSEAARPVLARQLHDLGELLHFRDDPELKDTVLLDAQFVTKKISDVLEYDGIEDGLGIFTREHMRKCWPDVEYGLQDRFLHLMSRFDLSYEIPDDAENRSLVVERLSLDPVPFEDLWNTMHPDAGFREIRMKFDPQSTRPAGIPGWFIARSHRFTTHTHWKYGALFQDDRKHRRHLALLESSSQHRYVELSVRGPNPQSFFYVLRDGLELTFARFRGLVLRRTMPCPGRDRKDSSKPCGHEFDLADLEDRMQLDPPKLTIECPKCYEDVSVTKMLFGLHWTTESRVLERMDELEETVEEQAQQVLEELGDLQELTQRRFLTLFNAEQRLEESHCPRVFSLRPAKGKTWPVVGKLLGTKWRLQLYCEAPGHWHPAEEGKKKGEYPIPEPAKWLNTIAPWAKGLITAFKFAAYFANPVLGVSAEALSELLKSDIALMKALIDKLPDVMAGRDVKAEYELEEGGKSRAGGASLRGLRHLLTELDPKQEWGGLRKTLTPEGHWLWLCEEHAKVYRQ